MKKSLLVFFMSLFLIAATQALADDPFFVHLEDAVPEVNGKVHLTFLVQNNDISDIVSFDIEPCRGLYVDKAESHSGWAIAKQSVTTFKVHTAGRLRPGANGRFKVTVSGDLNIFRRRSARNLMTLTAYYNDGKKRVYEVVAPLIKNMR